LLGAASVPANIVNWGGSEPVSIEDWTAYLGELTTPTPILEYTATGTLESVVVDNAKLLSITGPLKTHWRDGFRRMIAARYPELLA
jgi:UDP-glucuronate 4-epimerase